MAKRKLAVINTGDTSLDKVWAHYKNPSKFPLTPKQKDVKERWLTAWSLLIKKKYKTKVAVILEEMYGVGRAQAFRDIRNAEKLYGNVLRADRDGQLALLYQFAQEGFKKSMKAEDYKSAKGFHAAMLECLPKENDSNYDPEKFADKPIKMHLPKAALIAITKALESGSLDFNKLAVDTDFEEIEDAENESE